MVSAALFFYHLQPECVECPTGLLGIGLDFVDDLGSLGHGLDGRPAGNDALGRSHVGVGILVDDFAILAIDRHLDNIKFVPLVGELVEGQLVGHGLVVAAVLGIISSRLGQVKRVAHPHQIALATIGSRYFGVDRNSLAAVRQDVKPVGGMGCRCATSAR